MNRFRILILSGVITAFCSHFAWAGTINSISVDLDNRTVVVSVQLSESSIDESRTETSCTGDGVFDIDIYAEADISMPYDYEVLVNFVIPECSEYTGISATLYSPLIEPGDNYGIMSVDSTMSTGDCNAGVSNCDAEHQACLLCENDCVMDFMSFTPNCTELCLSNEECLIELDTCNALWDASVVEELAVMTVQPIFPEVVERTENIVVDVDCKPNTLNMKSKGKWITCSVKVPGGGPGDIDVDSMKLNYMDSEGLDVVTSKIEDDLLMVKFSRQGLIELISSVEGPLEIELTDGTFFGTDTINVINRGKKKKIKKAKRVKKAKKVQLAKKK